MALKSNLLVPPLYLPVVLHRYLLPSAILPVTHWGEGGSQQLGPDLGPDNWPIVGVGWLPLTRNPNLLAAVVALRQHVDPFPMFHLFIAASVAACMDELDKTILLHSFHGVA